jgi:hypothetical protein
LETRAGWIEHHHVDLSKGIFSVPKEGIIPLGPGEYNPKKFESHISTPSLGGSQTVGVLPGIGPVGETMGTGLGMSSNMSGSLLSNWSPTAPSFGAHSRINTSRNSSRPSNSRNSSRSRRTLSPERVSEENRTEYVTIFHDYGSRQPIDTHRRFCPTKGPDYYEENTLLSEWSIDGKKTLKKVDFTKTPRFRGMYDKTAVGHYDVNYDSKHLKPRLKLGFIASARRLPIQIGAEDQSLLVQGPACYREEHHMKMSQISPPSSPKGASGTATMPLSPVRKPKLNHKPRNEYVFDASCYTEMKKQLVFDLSPGSIAQRVPKNIFGGLMVVPRPHQSRSIK